jgi:hypothetical protein
MKTGMLNCSNKKCSFVSKPTRILWTCSTCKTEFKSGAIPYNPLDIQVTKRLVSQTLLLKHKAHPNKMPCCKLNVFFTDFITKKLAVGYYMKVNWMTIKLLYVKNAKQLITMIDLIGLVQNVGKNLKIKWKLSHQIKV